MSEVGEILISGASMLGDTRAHLGDQNLLKPLGYECDLWRQLNSELCDCFILWRDGWLVADDAEEDDDDGGDAGSLGFSKFKSINFISIKLDFAFVNLDILVLS